MKIATRAAEKEIKQASKKIKQGEDPEDAVDDAVEEILSGPGLVQVFINKVLTDIQAELGEPGFDISEDALQQVIDYVDRIETIDQLKQFVDQITPLPDYQKIGAYLSTVVKPLRRHEKEQAAKSEDDEDPYAGVNDPGDPEDEEYSKNLEGGRTSIVDSLNNDMRKRKLLFEKKKNWMKGAVKKPGALNAAAKAAGESKSEYCASPPSGKAEKRCNLWKTFNKHRPEDEEDTEKERRYEDRWDKDLDREREREGSSSAGEYSDVDKDDFCGPAGGAAPGTYPVNSEKRARAALSYAHNAPDPEGLKRCVYRKAKEHGWFDEEDEEFRYSPMLDSHQSDTSGYLTEQVAKDNRNKIKPRTENQSFKERYKPKTHWQLQELKRRGL